MTATPFVLSVGSRSSETQRRGPPYVTGLMGIVAAATMLFTAFTAALLVRRAGHDWTWLDWPGILWFNSAVILVSSLTVELSRQRLRRGLRLAAGRWLWATALLGGLFLAGQGVAWWELVQRGVFLRTSPYASFFYLLTAIHAGHLLGGLGALGWAWRRWSAGAYEGSSQRLFTHVATYWHFVGGVWWYVFALLQLV